MKRYLLIAILQFISLSFGVYTSYIFFRCFLHNRRSTKAMPLTVFFLTAVLGGALSVLITERWVFEAVYAGLFICLAMLLYADRWYMRLFFAVFFALLEEAAMVLMRAAFSCFNTLTVIVPPDLLTTESMVLSSLFVFIVIVSIDRFSKDHAGWISKRYALLLFTIQAVGFCIILLHFKAGMAEKLTPTLVLIVACVIYIDVAVFLLFEGFLKQSKSELRCRLAEQQLGIQIRHYTQLMKNREMLQKILHDEKNHLLCIRSFAQRDDLDGLKEYLDQIMKITMQTPRTLDTGHPVIDAVLDDKKRIADEMGIRMEISIALPDDPGIDNIDICILLGNAVDNAIEACGRITAPDADKHISIVLAIKSGCLVFNVKNTAPDSADEARAEKKDPAFHGFGLENIRSAAEKYGGYLYTLRKEHSYLLSVVIPQRTAQLS